MLSRIWQIVTKELIHLRRDVLLVSFLVLGPVSELVLVAWSTSSPIEHLPTAIVDRDNTPLSRGLVVALENSETFDAAYYPSNEAELASLSVPLVLAKTCHLPLRHPLRSKCSWTGQIPPPRVWRR
jgi:hypothetical protein